MMRQSTNSKESDFEKKDQQLEAADLFSGKVNFARGSVMNEGFIYIIRDQKVMIDSDLAKLYGVETKAL